jgi:hypothetical protein
LGVGAWIPPCNEKGDGRETHKTVKHRGEKKVKEKRETEREKRADDA